MTEDKMIISEMMTDILNILNMLDNVKSNSVRVSLSPVSLEDVKSDKDTFLLQDGLMNDMIRHIKSNLKIRLGELEMNYIALRKDNKNE